MRIENDPKQNSGINNITLKSPKENFIAAMVEMKISELMDSGTKIPNPPLTEEEKHVREQRKRIARKTKGIPFPVDFYENGRIIASHTPPDRNWTLRETSNGLVVLPKEGVYTHVKGELNKR